MSLPSSAPPAVVVPDLPAASLPPPDLAIMDQPMVDGLGLPDEESAVPMQFGINSGFVSVWCGFPSIKSV